MPRYARLVQDADVTRRPAATGSSASSPRCVSPTCDRSPAEPVRSPTAARGGRTLARVPRRRRRLDPCACTGSRSTGCCRSSATAPSTSSRPPTSSSSSRSSTRPGRSGRRSARASSTSPPCSTTRASTRTRPATATSGCRTRRPTSCSPPTAEHVEAVYRTIPTMHRLPLLWLDWSGARVACVDKTRIGDYDEPRRRVTASAPRLEVPARSGSTCPTCSPTRSRRPCRHARTATPTPGCSPARRRRAPHVDREGVRGARDPALVTARPTAPPDLAAAPAGPLRGPRSPRSSGSGSSRSPPTPTPTSSSTPGGRPARAPRRGSVRCIGTA